MKRLNASLISEVMGLPYPLLLSAGPKPTEGGKHRWLISDVTNREGDAFVGDALETPSASFRSALEKFGGKAAYGRGRIGVRTAGLGLEKGAPTEMFVDSAPTDWALAQKRIDDLVETLAVLGLFVVSAGTASVVAGAVAAAARLVQRWRAGRLSLDDQTASDALAVFGALGAAGMLVTGLRVQKFGEVFTVMQEGGAAEAGIARAAEALRGAQNLAKAVMIANEAINYGGLLWGTLSFYDQMLSINEQERTGAMTHAEARRARASAISSAVQTGAMFLAGNMAKGKEAAKRAAAEGEPPSRRPAPERAPAPIEGAAPRPVEEAAQRPGEEAPTRAPKAAELPIGARRATTSKLEAALPRDLRQMLVVDESLEGDTAHAEYKLDPKTGLISEISLHCSPDALPTTVRLHTDTLRTMQKYQGFAGRLRQVMAWIAELVGVEKITPADRERFEAALEIPKLKEHIREQMGHLELAGPEGRAAAEAELDAMQMQLAQHLTTLEFGTVGEGVGYVAKKGVPKAKLKRYNELLAELRDLAPDSDPHKSKRWEMYQLIGGDLPYDTWEKVYHANMQRARKASAAERAEQSRLGWGEMQETVPVGKNQARRLDIVDATKTRAVEVKAYELGRIFATEDIVSEVQRDAQLVKKQGWDITWVLIDTTASEPLLKLLNDAGITVEYRTVESGYPSKLVKRILPDKSRRKR